MPLNKLLTCKMCIMKINKGLLVLSLLLLSVGKLSAEDFGYELKDGTLTILMYGKRPVSMIRVLLLR